MAAIYTVDVNGEGVRKVTRPERGMVNDQPDWSPDGSLLVFHRSGTPFQAERLAPAIAALGGPARPEPTFRGLRAAHVVVGTAIAEKEPL